MHPALAFTDSLKRVWPCLVTSAEVFACQARLGVKLLDLLDPDSDESQRLSPVDKMEVLLLVLERPLAEQGVSTEGFLRSIPTAPYIAAAWEALHAGILSFCQPSTPLLDQISRARRLIQGADKQANQEADRLLREMYDEWERRVTRSTTESSTKSGTVPHGAASTPPPTP